MSYRNQLLQDRNFAPTKTQAVEEAIYMFGSA